MIAANEVRVCMNEAGARRQPFLFGVDFELSEGFFVLDPLGQQEIQTILCMVSRLRAALADLCFILSCRIYTQSPQLFIKQIRTQSPCPF